MISIPITQSIRFRPIDSRLRNFDNTFAKDTDSVPYAYEHFLPAVVVRFQIVTDTATTATPIFYIEGVGTTVAVKTTVIIGSYKYETFTLDLTNRSGYCIYIDVFVNSILTHRSEPFQVESKPDFLQIEWFNSETNMMDYSTGLTHILQIDAKIWKMQPGGEISIYINQGTETKLKSTTNRVFLLECDLPLYIADMLISATDQDRFYINEVEYVVSKKPSISQLGRSDMYSFSCECTQKVIVGINSHDVG